MKPSTQRKAKRVVRKAKKAVVRTARRAKKAVQAKAHRAKKATRKDRKHFRKHAGEAARDAADVVVDAAKA